MPTHFRRSVWALPFIGLALAVSVVSPAAASGTASWPQFGADSAHSGVSVTETAIGPGNVSTLERAFTATLPGTSDGAVAFLAGVTTSSGPRDLLFTTSRDGRITALDAHNGAILWSHQNGPGSCHINNGSAVCYTTSSPAVDPNSRFVYSYGLDGKVHKYAVASGSEVVDASWPELATAKPFDEKGSSALTVATAAGVSYLYVANGGYPGDRGDYQGHVTTINLETGAQKVFNTLCSDRTIHFTTTASMDCAQKQSAVWARVGVEYDASTNRVYFATGNANFDGTQHWGDSVLALNPDGSGARGAPLDSYTPTNQLALDSVDQDLGSTAPAILARPVGSSVANIGVQGGKDAKLRLLDLSNLSGHGAPGHLGGELQLISVPQGGQVLTQPVSWVNPADGVPWVLVANSNGLSGLTAVSVNGLPRLVPQWTVTAGGTSPVLANGVAYYLTNGGARAVDPLTGAVLWADTSGTVNLHWQSPIAVGGYLYYPDGNGALRAFTLPKALVSRVAGTDRFATSVAVSAGFAPGVEVAYIATGAGLADALSGAAAAGMAKAPLLLVEQDTIPAVVGSRLISLAPKRIVVLGGLSSISDAVQQQLRAFTTGTVTRIAGVDRYGTSAAVSATFSAKVPVAYVSTGENFPDSLSGASRAAGMNGGPLLLVTRGAIPRSIEKELVRLAPQRIVVLGGSGAVSDAVQRQLDFYTTGTVTRLAGSDRYGTSAAISSTFAPGVGIAYIASGENYPDALAAAPVAGIAGSPLLLVTPGNIPDSISAELTRLHPGKIVLIGGSVAVSMAVQTALGAYVK